MCGYHPQTKGLTDRFNDTKADKLSFYVSFEQINFDSLLPRLKFSHNIAVQATTKVSPFRLQYGVDSAATFDTIFFFISLSDIVSLAGATRRSQKCRKLPDAVIWNRKQRRGCVMTSIIGMLNTSTRNWFGSWFPQESQVVVKGSFVSTMVHTELYATWYMVQPVDAPKDRKDTSTELPNLSRFIPYMAPGST